MEKDYFSLVLFTVLSQTAAGGLILREILLHSDLDYQISKEFRVLSLFITGIIIALALGAAFMHLGKQVNAVHSLRNLRSSWLSREILFIIIFSATVLLYWLNEKFWNIQVLNSILSFTGLLAGAGLLTSMSAIYMLPAVPSWNSMITPISFLITSAAGAVSLLVLLNAFCGCVTAKTLLAILAFAVILSLITSGFMFSYIKESGLLVFFIIRILMGLITLILIFLNYLNTFPNKMTALSVLFTTVLLTEMAGRVIFFLNYHKSGL